MMAYSDEELMAIANSPVKIPGNPGTTISVRQNNPGNIKDSPRDTLSVGAGARGFAIYPTPDAGFQAVMNLIERYKKQGGYTLASFANKYAPSYENDTNNWINVVGRMSGANPNTPLENIPTYELARGIVAIESSTPMPPMGQGLNLQPGPSDEELMAIAGQGKPIKPQPGKVQSIPDILGGALGQEGVTQGQGIADIQQPNTLIPQEDFTPGISESMAMFSPQAAWQGLKDIAGVMNKDVVLNQLPVAGMIAGGTVGGLSAGPMGAVPGAALGGAAGKSAELYFKGRQGQELPSIPSQAIQIGTSALGGATAEMGGQVTGQLLGRAFAPGRKWLEEQLASAGANRAVQELANQGIPVSPSTIAPSVPARAVTWLAERFQPGKSIVDSYRRQTMDMIMEMRRNLVEEMGLPPVGSQALGTSQQAIKDAFMQFKTAIGPKAEIPLPNTTEFLKTLSSETPKKYFDLDGNEITAGEFFKMFPAMPRPEAQTYVSGKSGQLIESWKNILQSGKATVEQIERINADLWPKGKAYGKMSATEKGWRDEFLQNMYKDLGAQEENLGVNLATLLQSAKGTARQNYQAQYLEGLLDKATNNETMMFNPRQFADLVKKNQNQILSRFEPEQAKYIFNFAEKMKAVAPERALFLKGREPTSLWEQAFSSGPAIGLAGSSLYSNPLMAVPIGFQAIVARSLMAPKGVVRKWLTTGFEPPILPVKIGIMEGQKND